MAVSENSAEKNESRRGTNDEVNPESRGKKNRTSDNKVSADKLSSEDLAGNEEEIERLLHGGAGNGQEDGETTEGEEYTESKIASDPASRVPEAVGILAGTVILTALIVLLFYLKLTKRKKPMKSDMSSTTGSPAGYNGDPNAVKVVDTANGCPVRIARIHGQGRRSAQQDSFGFSDVDNITSINEKGLFAVVADGMGGLEDGDRMSSMVVVSMLEGFDKSSGMDDPSSLLLKLLDEANDAVNEDLGSEKTGQCGSTVVSVIIRDRMLYFLSVGDSHIYVYRRGILTQINRDHNYAAQLDEMARNGEISLDEAALDPQRAALTSFIGMGDIELVDRNEQPISLEAGDRILLMSDGVYGTIHDEGIAFAMEEPLIGACYRINEMIYDEDKPNQDNFTCVILEITG